jgi:two-component sensor histidine kinase
LAEKETLLREIHHRVKNNLQVVSSLLSLQARQVTQSNATSILQDSQNRVRSMALIHEKLYQSSDLALIDFGGYLHSLCAALSRTYTGATQRVAFQVEAEVIGLELDQAMPCGLIVNELVANALKHAFPQERSGKIGVTLSRHGAQVRLEVFDTGVGLPSGLALLSSASLGMQLVQTLVAQIDGQLAVQSAPEAGTHFCIDFPHESMKGSG